MKWTVSVRESERILNSVKILSGVDLLLINHIVLFDQILECRLTMIQFLQHMSQNWTFESKSNQDSCSTAPNEMLLKTGFELP